MTRTPIVVVGTGEMGQVVDQYFADSPYEVVAFAATREFLEAPEFEGRPLVDFDQLGSGQYRPAAVKLFIAIGYVKLNHTRARFYERAKRDGYALVSYVHPSVQLWKSNTIGDNVFIFEDNTIQPFVGIGSDTILWSGNHIGHHTRVGNHVFISSHVVVSGNCDVGDYSFLGVNATIADEVKIGRECLIGAGALVTKSTGDGKLYAGDATSPHKVPAPRFAGVPDEPKPE